jgi:hypothetical protein
MRWSLPLLLVLVSCTEADKARRSFPNPNTPRVEAVESGSGTGRSQLHRLLGTVILTAEQESQSADNLRAGYDNVPNLNDSDDGMGGVPSVNLARRPLVDCGVALTLTTIDSRIADCASKNTDRAVWRGQQNGNAGEGNWFLVLRQTVDGNGKEVWLDATTNYLWSDLVASTNWCSASGNTEDALVENGVNCKAIHDGINVCVGQTVQGLGEGLVSWRLPTRGDFLMADLNGARYVLNRTAAHFWTATVNGDNREQAWTIIQATGVMTPMGRNEVRGVRCLGRRLP